MALPGPPLVSVVIATYNRPDVLALALASVQAQTYGSWEAVVVGDACTDDTGERVRALGDDRIRYVELPRNVGDQSGPNTVGTYLARGDLIAYLNHDDLWFPDHLSVGVARLSGPSVDVVIARGAMVLGPSSGRAGEVKLVGPDGGARFRVADFAPASTWVGRREAFVGVGGWTPAPRLRREASHDVLFRLLRRGAAIEGTGVLSVALVTSGDRPGSYVGGDREVAAREHRSLWDRIESDPSEVRRSLEGAVRPVVPTAGERRRRAVRERVDPVLVRAGINPREALAALRGAKRGEMIADLRRRRGLTATPSDGRAELARPLDAEGHHRHG